MSAPWNFVQNCWSDWWFNPLVEPPMTAPDVLKVPTQHMKPVAFLTHGVGPPILMHRVVVPIASLPMLLSGDLAAGNIVMQMYDDVTSGSYFWSVSDMSPVFAFDGINFNCEHQFIYFFLPGF